MGFLAGLKIISLDEEECVTQVPFKWLNKNPFQSMYFAVQSMAAELSTAAACLVAISGHTSSIAFIIVDCKANFYKKATQAVSFTCTNVNLAYEAVEECKKSGSATERTFKTLGVQSDGVVVSEFEFTWSFKVRKS